MKRDDLDPFIQNHLDYFLKKLINLEMNLDIEKKCLILVVNQDVTSLYKSKIDQKYFRESNKFLIIYEYFVALISYF